MSRTSRRILAALALLATVARPALAATIVLDASSGADYDAVGDGWFFTTPPNQPPDGIGDTGGNDLALAFQTGVVELRAMAEFPLAALAGLGGDAVLSASLTYYVDDVLSTFGPGTAFDGTASSPIAVYTYPADGTVTVADFLPAGLLQLQVVTTGALTDATLASGGPVRFDLEATDVVRDFLDAGETHLGVLWETTDSPTGCSLDGKSPPGVAGATLPFFTIEVAGEVTTTTSIPVVTTTTTTILAVPTTTIVAVPTTTSLADPTTSTTSSTVAGASTTTTTLSPTVDHPQAAQKLVLTAKRGKEKLVWVTKTPPVVLPGSDPAVTGATLEVRNPVTGERSAVALPASSWSGGTTGKIRKFLNKGAPGGSSVVKVVTVKRDKGLKVTARGTLVTLDEASQGSLEVVLTIGADRYCSACGAPTQDVAGRFTAKRCAAPATCP